MKKYRFLSNKRHTSSQIISCALLTTVLLSSACSKIDDMQPNQTDNDTLATTSIESTVTTETSYEVPDNLEEYDFSWSNEDSKGFDEYVQKKCYGMNIRLYIVSFGYTNELNDMLTEYVNQTYEKSYNYVPFSKVKYFRSYISVKEVNTYHAYRDYDFFCKNFCDNEKSWTSRFNNKLLFSYLIQNNIPFGEKIPIEYIQNFLDKETVYTYYDDEKLFSSRDLGNKDSSYEYKSTDLYLLIINYNVGISSFCASEGIPIRSFFHNDPEFQEETEEAVNIINELLRKRFGENAPQIGECITREQYIAIFGEEPLDLSYMPGVVLSQTPVKGNAQVRVDYDNYNVYYTPTPGYDEESSGRGRRM